MTLHFDESIMIGTRAISGSPAMRLQEAHHRRLAESSIASSMLMSMICAPFSTCWRATASASSNWPVEDHPREGLRAGDVGALADVDEERAAPMAIGSRPGQAQRRGRGGVVIVIAGWH